jgi:hypothetical protein
MPFGPVCDTPSSSTNFMAGRALLHFNRFLEPQYMMALRISTAWL